MDVRIDRNRLFLTVGAVSEITMVAHFLATGKLNRKAQRQVHELVNGRLKASIGNRTRYDETTAPALRLFVVGCLREVIAQLESAR